MALANAGWMVDAICPQPHPLDKTSSLRQTHAYRGLTPLLSLANAIAATKPDLIVPGDDPATLYLHRLYQRERRRGEAGGPICALIERSLGPPESFPIVYARTAFMELARHEDIRVPRTELVGNASDLRQCLARMGFPAVLKANCTSGGAGVKIIRTFDDAEDAFHSLQAPPLLARAAKRVLVDQDKTLVWPSLRRLRSVVNAQSFVAGREATSTVACWKGTVLAALHFEVLNKRDTVGPATVVRLIEHSEMSSAVEKMVRRLNLSGLHGFDFMLEEHTGNAYLIEINPRATQVGHLTLGPGRDLPAALYAAVSEQAVREAPTVTENKTITLFPQEWLRDPKSAFLESGYHDVPWEEPELVRACVHPRRKQNAWYSQENWVQAVAAVRSPRP
jgi:Carbamoyl-phosphate synthase L chain, ATP binding domain